MYIGVFIHTTKYYWNFKYMSIIYGENYDVILYDIDLNSEFIGNNYCHDFLFDRYYF